MAAGPLTFQHKHLGGLCRCRDDNTDVRPVLPAARREKQVETVAVRPQRPNALALKAVEMVISPKGQRRVERWTELKANLDKQS